MSKEAGSNRANGASSDFNEISKSLFEMDKIINMLWKRKGVSLDDTNVVGLQLNRLESKCNEALMTLHNAEKTAVLLSETRFSLVSKYRGATETIMGKIEVLRKDFMKALVYFKEAQIDLMNGHYHKKEIEAIKLYMQVAPNFFNLTKAAHRAKNISTLCKLCVRAKKLVSSGVDVRVLKHNCALLDRVKSHLSIEIVISDEQTESMFPLYSWGVQVSTSKQITLPKQATLVCDHLDKSTDKTELLPLFPNHGKIGNLINDGIHRSALACSSLVAKPFLAEGNIENSSFEDKNASTEENKIRKRVSEFSTRFRSKRENQVSKMHSRKVKPLTENDETGIFYWKDTGKQQNFTVSSFKDCRSYGILLGNLGEHNVDMFVDISPIDYARFSLVIEQSEAAKALLMMKRIGLKNTVTTYRSEKALLLFRENTTSFLTELDSVLTFSQLESMHRHIALGECDRKEVTPQCDVQTTGEGGKYGNHDDARGSNAEEFGHFGMCSGIRPTNHGEEVISNTEEETSGCIVQ